MAGTVTGKNAQLYIAAHNGTPSFTDDNKHSTWGIGDFSLTLDRGTVEQTLVGEEGNYFDQGSLSIEGSLTAAKFATSGLSDPLDNIISAEGASTYLAVSGCVSTDTDATYLSWYLKSCQVTGYDISTGDSDTITEASIDFIVMAPHAVTYSTPCIQDN